MGSLCTTLRVHEPQFEDYFSKMGHYHNLVEVSRRDTSSYNIRRSHPFHHYAHTDLRCCPSCTKYSNTVGPLYCPAIPFS